MPYDHGEYKEDQNRIDNSIKETGNKTANG